MKIVFDGLIYYLQKNGGISRYFDELINGLADRGDCDVYVLMRKGKMSNDFNPKVKVEIINSKILSGSNKLLKYLSVFIDRFIVSRFLSKRKDLHGSVFHSTYYTTITKLSFKSVITVHDFTHERFPDLFSGLINDIYRKSKKKAILKSDGLICVSEKTKKDLIDFYGFNNTELAVVHHGVSGVFNIKPENFKKHFVVNNEIGKPYFLYVGSRVDYKNFKLLLDSFSSWEFKNKYDLLCIGGGNLKEEEVLYIDKLGLSNNVFYLENVCDYDLVYYYNCAEAFIYPSLYEGFGMPILESIACGTPVICSDIEIFREIGKDLPLFFKDKNGLLECLNKVVSGYEFGDREYANLINNYSWRETTSKTFEFYKKILKK